ncbi:hypothetical protein EYF80_038806 [Liparis tanakae]|uniref:Uncharacterized protein n=1 Tax=Liparis tanakae TaxID=230148 RepID=A0A4Z2GE57_9TELE|nr:hypothetical protein EYF80_038806 [Liparis tanakae]
MALLFGPADAKSQGSDSRFRVKVPAVVVGEGPLRVPLGGRQRPQLAHQRVVGLRAAEREPLEFNRTNAPKEDALNSKTGPNSVSCVPEAVVCVLQRNLPAALDQDQDQKESSRGNDAAGSSSAGSWCLSLAVLSHFVLLYTVTGWKEDGPARAGHLWPLSADRSTCYSRPIRHTGPESTSAAFAQRGKPAAVMRDASCYLGVKIKHARLTPSGGEYRGKRP